MPTPPSTIGQNAAAYGRSKTPRTRRAKLVRLAVVAIAIAAIVVFYTLKR